MLSVLDIPFEADRKDSAWKYKVEGSTDDTNWEMIWDQTENKDMTKYHMTNLSTELSYRYLRVTITGCPGEALPAIVEFNAYGKSCMECLSHSFIFNDCAMPTDKWSGAIYSDNSLVVSPPKGSNYTVESLKALLNGKTVVVQGILNEQIVEDVDFEQVKSILDIKTYYPGTNIRNYSGMVVEITYVADPKNYINKVLKRFLAWMQIVV